MEFGNHFAVHSLAVNLSFLVFIEFIMWYGFLKILELPYSTLHFGLVHAVFSGEEELFKFVCLVVFFALLYIQAHVVRLLETSEIVHGDSTGNFLPYSDAGVIGIHTPSYVKIGRAHV